jgi:hypothetical protein
MTAFVTPVSQFVRAVTRRSSPANLALAALVMTALVFVSSMGIASAIWAAPVSVKIARLIEVTVMGILIVIAIMAADEAVDRGMPRAITYVVAVVGAAVVGALVGWEVRAALGFGFPSPGPNVTLNPAQPYLHRVDVATIGALVGGLATFVHVNRRTALAAQRRQHEAERARSRARRRTLESQLQALQARVEPMFLFGTLQRIRHLYRTDAAAASAMLEDLIVYLRAALPHLRESTSRVGQELTLARSWLDIVSRSAKDWHCEFDIADSLRDARIPALVLLPLVQCAVADAGAASLRLQVRVRGDARRLCVDVHTSSDAFAAGLAVNPLLEQISERLSALYGHSAEFTARRSNDAQGSDARIQLPLESSDAIANGSNP